MDDEPDLVDTCARLLARRGHACLIAHTGRQGITLIDRERPRLVLTDLYLPDVDGLSVLRHAAEQVPPIPGILMTAADTATDAIGHALEDGPRSVSSEAFFACRTARGVDRALK